MARRRNKSIRRSGYEDNFEKFLEGKKIPFDYEPGSYSYTLVKKYYPDWALRRKDGGIMYVETKGKFTSADRSKLRIIKESYPDLDLRLLFMKDNFLTKKSKTRYSMWAEKSGFKWHVANPPVIPVSWLRELKHK